MARRITTAREQVEMLAPWRRTASVAQPPSIHDLMPGQFSDGNGRWDYRHQGVSEDRYPVHSFGIHPVHSPASHSYIDHWGKPQTIHYDPAVTGGPPVPGKYNRHQWPTTGPLRNEITDMNPPGGMLWRGMSHEEYQEAKTRGYFESHGGHNIGDSQNGLTFFSTDPEQANNYATWFAPQETKPTFTHPGHIVGIPDRPDAPRGTNPSRPDPASTEVGLPGRVPFSEATHHYVGRPSVMDSGDQQVTEGWQGYERGSGSQPSTQIMWGPGEDHQRTARRSTANQPIKLYRGVRVNLPPDLVAEMREKIADPRSLEEAGRELDLGPKILDHLSSQPWSMAVRGGHETRTGLGGNWHPDPKKAHEAAYGYYDAAQQGTPWGDGTRAEFPLLMTAEVDQPGEVDPRTDHLAGEVHYPQGHPMNITSLVMQPEIDPDGQVYRRLPGGSSVELLHNPRYERHGIHPGGPRQYTASRRTAERADDFEWERSFDGGGGWELIVRNPDGNPVRVKTEPARGQRTSALQQRPPRQGELPFEDRDEDSRSLWERPHGLPEDFDPFGDLDGVTRYSARPKRSNHDR